jgi:hypothetical protein
LVALNLVITGGVSSAAKETSAVKSEARRVKIKETVILRMKKCYES